MTKSQDNVAVVLRKKQNGTPQIKFSNTSVSRLHISHFSIIYRRPQRDVAELVLAGGSKLRSRKERRGHVLRHGWDDGSSRSLGGPPGGEGFCYAVLGGGGGPRWLHGSSLEGPPLPQGLCLHQSRDGEARTLAAISPSLGMWVPEVSFFFFFPPASPWMGRLDLKGTFSPSPRWVVVKGGGVFSSSPWKIRLQNIKGGVSQGLQDHDQDPHVVGDRHEGSWIPGGSGQFPDRSPGRPGTIGLHVR